MKPGRSGGPYLQHGLVWLPQHGLVWPRSRAGLATLTASSQVWWTLATTRTGLATTTRVGLATLTASSQVGLVDPSYNTGWFGYHNTGWFGHCNTGWFGHCNTGWFGHCNTGWFGHCNTGWFGHAHGVKPGRSGGPYLQHALVWPGARREAR